MAVQEGLCRTLSETPKTGFLTLQLILWFVLSLSDTSMVSKSSIMFPAKPSNKSVIVLKDCPLLTAFDFPVSVLEFD